MRKTFSQNHNDLYALINNLDAIEAAILKERIYSHSRELILSKDEFREVNKDGLIHPDLYINTMEKVYDFLEERFQKQMKIKNN